MTASTSDVGDLEDLTPEALAKLDRSVVEVAADGRVLRCSSAAAGLWDLTPEQAVGRHFFREIAPGTNLPAFHGRFLEGVRAGELNERFAFTLGAADGPLRLDVLMAQGRTPGRFWIVLQPLERLARLRPSDAAYAVESRVHAQPLDAGVCEREPIHIPGTVQPHAALLAVDPDTGGVTACSANLPAVLGLEPEAVLGRPISGVLPPALLEAIEGARARGELDPATPLRCDTRLGVDGAPAVALVHVHAGRLLIELEPAPVHGEDFGAPTVAAVESALARLGRAPDLPAAAGGAADLLREITGFQRVLIYRFDRDWNGEAIAEARDPDAYDSLLGLHFPASDIPAQARALYRHAPARFVIDRDYAPAPLLADPEAGNQPLDLTFAAARSLSPVHLEYQRNLGVNGSMSCSIIVDDRLWGLAIGHHRAPHYLAPETRSAAAAITAALALQIGKLQLAAAWAEQERHVEAETRLLARMAGGDDLVDALLGGEPSLLDVFGAGGAAVIDGESVRTAGAAPDEAAVRALLAWAREQGEPVLLTEQLSVEFPPAAAYRETASGLLLAFTAPDRRRALLWFRPEEVAEVAWGGDPHKAVLAGSGGAAVLPRRSFERWVETRRGASLPWAGWQGAAARRLAGAVESVALRQNREIAALNARGQALAAALRERELLLEQKDVLTREIDHRVMNSLQIVASFVRMQGRLTADPEARAAFEDTYGRVMSVARIHDSLYRSDDVGEVDIGHTIAALCRDLSGMAGEGQTLAVDVAPDLKLPYQRAIAFSLIAVELVTNAFKYAYAPGEAGQVRIDLKPHDGDGVCMTVSDGGRGLPEDWATGPRQSGLGMKLINAMLAQLGGEMKVDSGRGARFVVCA